MGERIDQLVLVLVLVLVVELVVVVVVLVVVVVGGESVQGGARTTLSPTVLTDDIPPTFLDGLLRHTLLYIAPSSKTLDDTIRGADGCEYYHHWHCLEGASYPLRHLLISSPQELGLKMAKAGW